jgi:hypothetical protein
VKEVSWVQVRFFLSFEPVFELKLTRDDVPVKMVGPVMMATGDDSREES